MIITALLEFQNCINYYTHLPLQGVGYCEDVETKLTPPVSHCEDVETKLTPPVSHDNNHTVEPRNTSQEDQLHCGVPTRNIYNTLENNALEVRENDQVKQFDLYTLMDGCTFPHAGTCNVLQSGTLCSDRGMYTTLLVYLNFKFVMSL